jgi:hypothetical protein
MSDTVKHAPLLAVAAPATVRFVGILTGLGTLTIDALGVCAVASLAKRHQHEPDHQHADVTQQ